MRRRQLEDDRGERSVLPMRRGARQPRDPMSERKNAILIALLEQLLRSEQEHRARPGQRKPREFTILWDKERQRDDGREFKAVRDVYHQDYGKWRVTSSYNIDGRGTPGWRFTHKP